MATTSRRRSLTTLLIMVLLSSALPAGAETAREILDRRKALEDTTRKWADREQRVSLTIHSSRGSERHRRLVIYERRLPDDERQTILFFEEPAEVRGTGFLSLSKSGSAAEQWLYLPALSRVRQITAATRTQSFVGTDLSYHDLDLIHEMTSWTEEDAESELLREEVVDDVATHVISLTPQRDDIEYARILLWIGIDDLVSHRLEFFDEKPDPVKRVEQREIRDVGTIPVAHRLEIERLRRESRTVMIVDDVRFDQELDESLFSQRSLERGER